MHRVPGPGISDADVAHRVPPEQKIPPPPNALLPAHMTKPLLAQIPPTLSKLDPPDFGIAWDLPVNALGPNINGRK